MSTFLNKIYDKYENRDFTYGQDNLNPLREIVPSDIRSKNDITKETIDLIAKRVEEIKNSLKKNNITITQSEEYTFGDDESTTTGTVTTSTSGGGEKPTDNTLSNDLAINRAGNSGKFIFPLDSYQSSLDDDIDPIMKQIELLLLKIDSTALASSSLPTPSGKVDPTPTVKDIDTNGDDPYPADITTPPIIESFCEDIMKDFNGLDTTISSSNLYNGKGSSTSDSGSADSSGSSSSSISGSAIGISSSDLANINKEISNENSAAAKCAAKELSALKIILAILKIINILKKIISICLSITSVVANTAALAGGAWLNPCNIGKLVQDLIQKAMAISVSIISALIQRLWDNMNMDCLSDVTKDYIDQINQLLAGIDSIKSATDTSYMSFQLNDWKSKIVNPFSTVVDEIKELKNSTSEYGNQIAESVGISDIKDMITSGSFLESVSPEIATKVESILSSSKKSYEQMKKLASSSGLNKSETSVMSKAENQIVK